MPSTAGEHPIGHPVVVGIDASNLLDGGGLTHLANLIEHAPLTGGTVGRVSVWARPVVAERLPVREGVEVAGPPQLAGGLLQRLTWQRSHLPRECRRSGCDVLFVPGGALRTGYGLPVVSMFRNALLFDHSERRRYPVWSPARWRLEILRRGQMRAMQSVAGTVFLSRYAYELASADVRVRNYALIPHGISPRFFAVGARSRQRPEGRYRLLYVSPVYRYKHHDTVIAALKIVLERGFDVGLRIVGPLRDKRATQRMFAAIEDLGARRDRVEVVGAIPHGEIDREYADADALVFASTCENLPNTMLEGMAAGLPVLASSSRPMSELAEGAALFFDPESPASIASAIIELVSDREIQRRLSEAGPAKVQGMTWARTAEQTFRFLADVARRPIGATGDGS
jgi:glycosyltransferase involved in cell wall biosynthesis